MNKLFLAFCIMFVSFLVLAQEEIPKQNINQIRQNSVYLEIFGNGIYTISLNYERIFKGFNNFGIRAGVGYFPPIDGINNRKYYSVPLELIWLIFKGQNHLELGAGVTFLSEEDEDSTDIRLDGILYIPRIGYRYNGNKGLILRAGITPVYDPSRDVFSFPFNFFGGISIGYSF